MAPDRDPTRPAPDAAEPGVPATSEQPEDVPPGWEAAEDMPMRDTPEGVIAWGTTAREERSQEPLAERVGRESPDELGPPEHGTRLVESGDGGGYFDDEADAVAEADGRRDDTLTAEEAAVGVEEEPPGITYDDDPGYVRED